MSAVKKDLPPFIIYQSELITKRCGFPHWKADPLNRDEIQIGDVGIIQQGTFLKLMTLRKSEEVVGDNHHAVKFYKLRGTDGNFVAGNEILVESEVLSDAVPETEFLSEHMRNLTVQGSVELGVREVGTSIGGSARFKYSCSKEKGAALVVIKPEFASDLGEQAISREYLPFADHEILGQYFGTNYSEWRRENRHLEAAYNNGDDVLLITGFHKSWDWAACVYSSASHSGEGSFTIQVGKAAAIHGSFNEEIHHDTGTCRRSGGHFHHSQALVNDDNYSRYKNCDCAIRKREVNDQDREGGSWLKKNNPFSLKIEYKPRKNQAIFLEGWRVLRKKGLLKRPTLEDVVRNMKAGAEPKDLRRSPKEDDSDDDLVDLTSIGGLREDDAREDSLYDQVANQIFEVYADDDLALVHDDDVKLLLDQEAGRPSSHEDYFALLNPELRISSWNTEDPLVARVTAGEQTTPPDRDILNEKLANEADTKGEASFDDDEPQFWTGEKENTSGASFHYNEPRFWTGEKENTSGASFNDDELPSWAAEKEKYRPQGILQTEQRARLRIKEVFSETLADIRNLGSKVKLEFPTKAPTRGEILALASQAMLQLSTENTNLEDKVRRLEEEIERLQKEIGTLRISGTTPGVSEMDVDLVVS